MPTEDTNHIEVDVRPIRKTRQRHAIKSSESSQMITISVMLLPGM